MNARCTQCNDIFRVEKPADPAPEPVMELPEIPAAPVVEEAPVAVEEPAATFEAPPAVEEAVPEPPPLPETPDFSAPQAAPPEAPALDPTPDFASPTADADPFAETAPFEVGSSAPGEAAPAEAAPEPPAEAAAPVSGFTFGKRDPTDKAKRLARVLVSDMIMYNAERHQTALEAGTLVQDFEEEIQKSWKEYVEQVGDDMANGEGRQFWTAALNDILAKGEDVF